MTRVEIGLLGPLRVVVDGRPVALPGERLPVLLAVLAMSAGQPVPSERLATAVWGVDLGVDARTNLQTNVRRLRRLLGDDVVATRGSAYALVVEPSCVDALRFGQLLEGALLADAVGSWRGEPFDGIRSDWLERTYGDRLREQYLSAVERLLDSGGKVDVGVLTELADRHPLRESLWLRLLAALRQAGRPAEALERYERLRHRLAEELGTDPGPPLQAMHAELLTGEPVAQRVVPRQLPPDTVPFTGRDAELAMLDGLESGPVTISGTAGVGKTTLAVHWAHRVAERFADGQLYVDLRGFDSSESPLAPAEALRGFLDALGVSPQQVPASLSAQAGLYRSLLAGTRTLVVLDNARDAGQVAPLLPGAPGCQVVVTSRNQLPGLVASAGARPLALDLLSAGEAERLLSLRLGVDRVAAEPAAVGALVARCARLPLALAIVAARAALRPSLSLAALAEEVGAQDGLDGFDAGDVATSARTVFSWSYRLLSPPAARLFGQLALHPGPDLGASAAASLAGVGADRELAELVRAHLLTERSPGRYASHDLLRAYARELVMADEPATRRMLDHYTHTAHAADRLLFSHGETITLGSSAAGAVVLPFAGEDEALEWFDAERQVLLMLVPYAAAHGYDQHACHLAWALDVYLHRQGHWHDRVTMLHTAASSARRLGSLVGESRSHRSVGFAYAGLGRFDDAYAHLDRALALAADPVDQAWTHHYRDLVYGQQGREAEALASAREALALFRSASHVVGEAIALTDVSWYAGRLEEGGDALPNGLRALELHRELGNRAYEAHTLSCLADTYQRRGAVADAARCYRDAVAVFAALGDRFGEASAYAHLGALLDDADARGRAEAILDDLDPPAREQIRSMLL